MENLLKPMEVKFVVDDDEKSEDIKKLEHDVEVGCSHINGVVGMIIEKLQERNLMIIKDNKRLMKENRDLNQQYNEYEKHMIIQLKEQSALLREQVKETEEWKEKYEKCERRRIVEDNYTTHKIEESYNRQKANANEIQNLKLRIRELNKENPEKSELTKKNKLNENEILILKNQLEEFKLKLRISQDRDRNINNVYSFNEELIKENKILKDKIIELEFNKEINGEEQSSNKETTV